MEDWTEWSTLPRGETPAPSPFGMAIIVDIGKLLMSAVVFNDGLKSSDLFKSFPDDWKVLAVDAS